MNQKIGIEFITEIALLEAFDKYLAVVCEGASNET